MSNKFVAMFDSEEDAQYFLNDAKKTKWLIKAEHSVEKIKTSVIIRLKESVADVYMTPLNKLANQYHMLRCEY